MARNQGIPFPGLGSQTGQELEKANWVLGTHPFLLLTVGVKGLPASNSNPDFFELMMDYNLNLKDKNNSFLP